MIPEGRKLHPMNTNSRKFDMLFKDPPKLHFWAGDWQTGGLGWRKIFEDMSDMLKDSTQGHSGVIIETGAGLSTLVFLLLPIHKLISVAPDPGLKERIYTEASARKIETKPLDFYVARSEEILPQLTLKPAFIDLGLIDGGHGWPTVFVDFCYISRSLKNGGYIVIDDIKLYSVNQLVLLLMNQPGWKLVMLKEKLAAFKKENDEPFLPDFGKQPYIVKNSTIPLKDWSLNQK